MIQFKVTIDGLGYDEDIVFNSKSFTLFINTSGGAIMAEFFKSPEILIGVYYDRN